MFQNPIADGIQGNRREGLFDLTVFAGRAGPTGLKQVIELWQAYNRHVFIACSFECSFDLAQVLSDRHLHIVFAVERQHWAFYLCQRQARVIG